MITLTSQQKREAEKAYKLKLLNEKKVEEAAVKINAHTITEREVIRKMINAGYRIS